MNTLYNYENINSLINKFPEMTKSFNEIIEEMKEYNENIERFNSKTIENEDEEEVIKMKEKEYDKLKEIIEKRKLLRNKGEESKEKIDEIRKNIQEICNNCRKDENNLMNFSNKLINEMNIIEERIKNKKVKEIMNKMEEMIKEMNETEEKYKKRYLEREEERIKYLKEEDKREYDKYCQEMYRLEEENNIEKGKIIIRIDCKEEYIQIAKEEMKKREEGERKSSEEKLKRINIDVKDVEEIEKWTNKKIGNILFNSDKNKWSESDSEFSKTLLGKKDVIIIVEDTDGNKFGGYVGNPIDKLDSWVQSNNCFVFSLKKSDGRGKRKFEPKSACEVLKNENKEYGFYLYDDNSNSLFIFGGGFDIRVYKKNNNEGYCNTIGTNVTYSYKGESKPLSDVEYGSYFKIKKITVLEME